LELKISEGEIELKKKHLIGLIDLAKERENQKIAQQSTVGKSKEEKDLDKHFKKLWDGERTKKSTRGIDFIGVSGSIEKDIGT